MRYCVSDIHGEYELFCALLDKIGFCDTDEMYICGDIVEKGDSSVRLLNYVSSLPNVHAIIGNHEYAFLKFYNRLLAESPEDFDAVLRRLRAYFPEDGKLLEWELMDWLERLPTYIEREDFICVHAGMPLDPSGAPLPLALAEDEELLYDRRFKDPACTYSGERCVFFGHTETECVIGRPEIIVYPRAGVTCPSSVREISRVHLDTGCWHSGVLGCFAIDTLEQIYVTKKK